MPDIVSPFVGRPLTPAEADRLAAVMKAIADPARLQLLSILASGGIWAGYDLVRELGRLSQPCVHHHLHILAEAGMVDAYRDGRYVQHRLVPDRLTELAALLRPGRVR